MTFVPRTLLLALAAALIMTLAAPISPVSVLGDTPVAEAKGKKPKKKSKKKRAKLVTYTGTGTVADVDADLSVLWVDFESKNVALRKLLGNKDGEVKVLIGARTVLTGDLDGVCAGDTVMVQVKTRAKLKRDFGKVAATKVVITPSEDSCADDELEDEITGDEEFDDDEPLEEDEPLDEGEFDDGFDEDLHDDEV